MRPVSPRLTRDEMRRLVSFAAADNKRAMNPESATPKTEQRLGQERKPPDPRKGPGPSKLAYRVSRAWAKPIVRSTVLVYLPLALLGLAGWRVAADDQMRGAIEARVAAVIERIAERPEFAVRGVAVSGGSTGLRIDVHAVIDVEPGTSSLKLDIDELRRRVEALGPVESAAVQFDPQGTLMVRVVERIPAVLYRNAENRLVVMDRGGVEIGPASIRANYRDLPVILGEGAPEHVGEALALLKAAPDIVPRLRAFVRVGERRWDMVLDQDMLVKLPAEKSAEALKQIMALHYAQDLLDRDLAVIDMRLPERPALRMNPEAAETYQIRRAVAAVGGEET